MAVLRTTQPRGDRELPIKKETPAEKLRAKALANSYNIDSVVPAAPLTLNVEPSPEVAPINLLPNTAGQDPSGQNNISDAQLLANQPQTNVTDIQGANTANDLATTLSKQKTDLEKEIETMSRNMANLPQAQIDAKNKLGINEDQKALDVLRSDLSKVKQNLLVAQDEEVAIGERGRQRISDFAGTAGDFGNLTNENLRQNRLDQLVQGRNLSRLGDTVTNIQASIDSNVAAINERATAERAKIEFDINQKNAILDRVIQTQGSILSDKQKADLENVKQNNAIELLREKARIDDRASGADSLARANVSSFIAQNYLNSDNPDDRDKIADEAYRNGEIDAGKYLTMKTDNAKDKAAQAIAKDKQKKEIATQNAASQVVIRTSDEMLASVDKLLEANQDGSLGGILGKFDQYDWIATWSDESKGLVAALDHIFSSKTVESLAQMKGNPSDKDMAVVEQMARQGFDRSIDDPSTLVNILTNMKNGLEDAKLIEATSIKRNNGAIVEDMDTIDDVERLLNNELEDLSAKVDVDKLVAIESGGNYTALNPTSGAYGKYQFIPSTLSEYANKLNMTEEEAKTPQGQERMFAQFTKDNINGLEKAKIPVNTATTYLAHQQGLGGAKQIIAGNISPTVRRNILANIPARYANASDDEVIQGWMDKFLPQLV